MGHSAHKIKQFFFVLIKIGIVVLAFYFIYKRVANDPALELNTFLEYLKKNHLFELKTALILFTLTILNWFFEILKWKTLVAALTKISFKNSMEQSLGALTASLFTPNRIGEYGVKAFYFHRSNRKQVVAINFMGNMMQMAVTTIFGSAGLILFEQQYNTKLFYIDIYTAIVIVSIFTVIFFLILNRSNFQIKGFTLDKLKHFFEKIPQRIYILGMVLSTLRYFIFSFQFYVLLNFFDVQLGYGQSMIVITSMYILASVIPSLAIFDVVIKGSVALFLFSFAGVGTLTILSITTLMWILNFALPAIFGSYFVLNFKLPK